MVDDVHFHPVSGFLGAGKTTTLLAAARLLGERGGRPAIVTNDQGSELVDTGLIRTVTDRVAEVTGGCFCCTGCSRGPWPPARTPSWPTCTTANWPRPS